MKKRRQNFKKIVGILCCSLVTLGLVAQDFTSHIIDEEVIGPAGIWACHMDDDAYKDVLVAAWDNQSIELYLSNGSWPLTWSKTTVAADFAGASYVSAGDIDGDGNSDIIASAYDDHEIAWWHLEEDVWVKYQVATGFLQAHEVKLCDMDADGDLDVLGAAAQSNKISWFENSGAYENEWTEHIIDENYAGARSVDAADIDNDGDIDLAGAALLDNEITWWRNDGGDPLLFTKITIHNSFTYAHEVQVVDMDLDGHLDLLGTSYGNGIKWWKNIPGDSITWTLNPVSGFSTAVISKALDYDNDGDQDIVATSQGSGRVALFENMGDNTLTWDYQVIEIFGGVWPLDIGDMDNDGDIDLLAGGNSANQIRWYENGFISNDPLIDYDGNIYQTVEIGEQIWMKENLKSLHYADGSEITEVWTYDDDESYADIYGRLYTWDAAMKYTQIESSQGVCPDGWHLPSDAEWTILGDYLGGDAQAGGKMKTQGTEHWLAPNEGATNESGFSALPGGEHDHIEYRLLGETAVIWSSTETNTQTCLYRYISHDDPGLHTYNYYKDFRYSVRCVKDETVGIPAQTENKKMGLILQPNPAQDYVFIDQEGFSEYISIELYMYSINGKQFELQWDKSARINISMIPSGVYLLKAIGDGQVYTNILIKE